MNKEKIHFKLLEGPLTLDEYEQAAEGNGLDLKHPSTDRVARLLFTLEMYQYDDLTGLLKRDPFMNKLQSRINDLNTGGSDAGQKYPKSFLVMLDIQGLHEINEQLGHMAGDQKIKAVGHFLDSGIVLPENGMEATGCRLGGDEFAILVSYDPEHYDLDTASQSIYSRLNLKMTGDADFPALNLGQAAEIKRGTNIIESFKKADPKGPQTSGERVAKKIGRVKAILGGRPPGERRKR